MEARDAREVAKKLIKSGAISPIVKTPKRSENEGFKRPSRFRGLDKKLIEEKAVAGYQPFASSPLDDREDGKPAFNPKVKVCFEYNLWIRLFCWRNEFCACSFFRACTIVLFPKKLKKLEVNLRNQKRANQISSQNKAILYSFLVTKSTKNF